MGAFNSRAPVAFHVMTKPIGPLCNLACRYCFYLHKEELLPESDPRAWRMTDQTLETYIRQYIAAQDVPQIEFAWQGGEPTLMGLDFFRRVIELQQKHCPDGVTINNAFQTNAVLIDDEWAAFLKEHDFLVGVSIDGPRELHDAFRTDRRGRGSWERVMAGRRRLQEHGVRHNALVCVNRKTADHPLDVYRFFRDEAFEWVQFIPIVERRDYEYNSPGVEAPRQRTPAEFVQSWAVLPRQYGRFLCAIFDEWIRHDVGKVFVQIFEEAAAAWLGYEPNLCIFRRTCGKAMALEHDGTLYSCDHYVYPDFRLGNIHEQDIRELATQPFQEQFGADKEAKLPDACIKCPVRFICNGGCPKDRFLYTRDGRPGLNYLCQGYRDFFTHADPYLRTLADVLRRGRPATEVSALILQSDQLEDAKATSATGQRRRRGKRRKGAREPNG